MTLDNQLRNRGERLEFGDPVNNVIIELRGSYLGDVNSYLNNERIWHCNLHDMFRIILSPVAYHEIITIDEKHAVHITQHFIDQAGNDAWQKIDPLFEIMQQSRYGFPSTYESSKKRASGIITHHDDFDQNKYPGVFRLSNTVSWLGHELTTVYRLALDPSVTQISSGNKMFSGMRS